MNLQMRLKDERKLGLQEGIKLGQDQGMKRGLEQGLEQGRDEMALGLIQALQAQGMPPKQIIEALALTRKISLAEAQRYFEKFAQTDHGGAH